MNAGNGLVTMRRVAVSSAVSGNGQADRSGGDVFVGVPLPRGAAPEDVLPAVRTTLSNDTRRYVCYSERAEGDTVASTRLSVDPEVVVSLELWR